MYPTNAEENKLPIVVENNKNFAIELVFKGLNSSNIAILGPNDILALGGNNGKVYRILNGQMLEEPIIDLNSFHQDGLIGIATVKNPKWSTLCFLVP
jgi:aldose sugar dehydrogenase